jgi:hypothetical protein
MPVLMGWGIIVGNFDVINSWPPCCFGDIICWSCLFKWFDTALFIIIKGLVVCALWWCCVGAAIKNCAQTGSLSAAEVGIARGENIIWSSWGFISPIPLHVYANIYLISQFKVGLLQCKWWPPPCGLTRSSWNLNPPFYTSLPVHSRCRVQIANCERAHRMHEWWS